MKCIVTDKFDSIQLHCCKV